MKNNQTIKRWITTLFLISLFPVQTLAATKNDDFSYHSNNSRSIKKGSIKNKIAKKIKETKISEKNTSEQTPIKTTQEKAPLEEKSITEPEAPTANIQESESSETTVEPEPEANDQINEIEKIPTEETPPPAQPQNPKLSKFINQFDTERYNAARIIDNNCQEKYGCNPYLMMGVIKRESNAQIWRVNKSGAAGIAQFLPETARGYGLFVPEYENEQCKQNNLPDGEGLFTKNTVIAVACDIEKDERFNLEKSVKAMIQKVLNLIHQNNGNDRMALANYNGGWWPSFFKDSFSKDTDACIDEITAQTPEIEPDVFLVVTQGEQTVHDGMTPFTAPNDKIVTRANIEQVCSYVNSVSAYKESFMVGQWP